ncbi:carboxylesterase/lipase family protein [Amycolatopsis acidiphila]|uniref:Carboxylesterase/lipase family protein n=1 Tax=Amycolatopsis acidiphila TaxID=715473 RepID=A0A558AD31_9PSEU|nr:carboxylesterase/lipase family protein [Amycolatopsis acidiphila]TVT22155.1 carboxylesterase/lipase family protein [Amycolatopsis acidiphila]UIJ61646.1 carboxylesterase/lipase family protein [Amycolatopsis acidiphila]GHG58682.1 carboxylesterase [Amycolatopsis acidiphila]
MNVTIADGTLRGEERDGVRIFTGIPYAAPPVGELRFAPPHPVEPWPGVLPGSRRSSLQAHVLGRGLSGSEDCLYLNVYAPAASGPHPVFVWIHGGGGITGSPNEYDGTRFAQHGVVVVTVAYRLGALGLLYLPESLGGRNFALLDQLAALHWVRDNVAAFGGDPARVTLAGESNGGRTVGTLLAVPAAQGLFQQAIVQSGTGVGALVDSPETASGTAAQLLDELGADADELRDLPAEQIVEAQIRLAARSGARVPYRVVVDGSPLVERPLDAVAAGTASGVRLLIGTNHDEHDLFRMLGQAQGAMMLGPEEFTEVISAYRRRFPDETNLEGRVVTASDWWLPAIRYAEAQHAAGGEVWMYRLDWRTGVQGMGACHGLDLPLIFDDVDNRYFRLFLGRDTRRAGTVARAMHDAWVRFVHGEPSWPRYEPECRTTMLFDTVSRPADDPDRDERLLWASEQQR